MPSLFHYYHESDKGSVFKLTPGLCSPVDYEPLNLPGTCSCLHITFLIAFWLMVPVIFFSGSFCCALFGWVLRVFFFLGLFFFALLGWLLSFTKYTYFIFFFCLLFELIAYLSGKT